MSDAAQYRLGSDGRVIYEGYNYDQIGEIYRVTGRTVRSWVTKGKAFDDIPPCLDAGALAAWWRRRMKGEVPDAILAKAGEVIERRSVESLGPKKEAFGLDSADLGAVEIGSATESYERVCAMEAKSFQALEKELAAESPNREAIDYWDKRYEKYADKRRAWEKDLPGIQKSWGKVMDVSKAIPVLVSIAGAIRGAMERQLLKFLSSIIEDIESRYLIDLSDYMDKKARREYCRRYSDAICEDVQDSEFGLALK